jgi:hypothetical protein
MTRTVHELPFLAPVPRGHDVLVATMRRAPDSSVLYCGESLWGPRPIVERRLQPQRPVTKLHPWGEVQSASVVQRATHALGRPDPVETHS